MIGNSFQTCIHILTTFSTQIAPKIELSPATSGRGAGWVATWGRACFEVSFYNFSLELAFCCFQVSCYSCWPILYLTHHWSLFFPFRKVFIEDIYKRLLPERYETSVSEVDLDWGIMHIMHIEHIVHIEQIVHIMHIVHIVPSCSSWLRYIVYCALII